MNYPEGTRLVQCDHIFENPKRHPAYTYMNIGNVIIECCLTCWNAIKGQVFEGETQRLLEINHNREQSNE